MKKNTSWKFTDESSVIFQFSVSGPGEFGQMSFRAPKTFKKCTFRERNTNQRVAYAEKGLNAHFDSNSSVMDEFANYSGA